MNITQTKNAHKVTDQSAIAPREPYSTGSVISQDGTRLRYLQLGKGPGVVMLHGAMESAKSHMQLAQGLADSFTVYLPERRGHNLGFPFVKEYSIQKEVQDLEALMSKTDTRYVFGVSSGGLICLQAALTLPIIRKVALYEPALIVNGSASTAFLPRYDREIAEGKIAAALISGMIGAQLGPPAFNRMPRWLLELLTTLTMKQEDKKARAHDVTMRMLAPTLHYDFQLVAQMAESLEDFKAIRAEVLLLGGSNSPAWLKSALDALATVLPHAKRIEFPGLDHGGSSDISSTNRSGQPELVASELCRFFA
ncbi:MAG TPA: alpha/beta hydrolase [Anaerolineales bacterium]|nr:alpha/beta hydrolase [Anaerolineales bacterium]